VPDQYDSIADLYEQVKRIPIGLAETATVVSALPDLAGKSVLDVGAGAGYYPRLFRRKGAARVVGVDASREMIAHAQLLEERDPLGISYEVHDAARLPVLGRFDVVTAIWLLGYAPGIEALDTMIGGLAANLAPGGDLVTLFPNPEVDWDVMASYSPYGMHVLRTGESLGRTSTTVHVETEPPFEFESFFWPPGVAEAALERGGFTDLRRQAPVVPEDAVTERGEEFWARLRACPTFAVYSAKPA
jgi:SAM-dependent methyltransferase